MNLRIIAAYFSRITESVHAFSKAWKREGWIFPSLGK